MNSFLHEAYKYSAYTENGAVSHRSTGSELLNYFSGSGSGIWYSDYQLASDQLAKLWEESPLMTLQMIFYNRMITRKVYGVSPTVTLQRGQGNRSDFRLALRWLAEHHPECLKKNLWVVPEVGCWKDLWHQRTLAYLPKVEIYELVRQRLEDPYHRDLLAKYLPRIRSKSNTRNGTHKQKNAFAYGLIKYLGWSPVDYRKFKTTGKSHEFQRQMVRNEWDNIDFKTIPGKALSLLSTPDQNDQTLIEKHHQEKRYLEWISTQPVAKFTGYPHQLLKVMRKRTFWSTRYRKLKLFQDYTLNKQFEGLLSKAREDVGPIRKNMWVAIDTSGSMSFHLPDDSTAFEVAISMGIYFSSLNQGAFQDHVIMFDDISRKLKLEGTFTEKVLQITSAHTAWGSTNFQSVVDEIIRIRTSHPDIPLEDYPDTLLVITDLQFNPAGDNSESNYEVARQKLARVGLPEMQFIWWNVAGRAMDRPNLADDSDVMMLSGFDGAILAYLLNQEQEEQPLDKAVKPPKQEISPYKAMIKALNQEILTKVRI